MSESPAPVTITPYENDVIKIHLFLLAVDPNIYEVDDTLNECYNILQVEKTKHHPQKREFTSHRIKVMSINRECGW